MNVEATTVTEPLGRAFPVEQQSHRPIRISILFGPDRGRELTSSAPLVRIGTDADAELVLGDSSVSRMHLEVSRTPEGLRVRDLGSRNGTVLEGRRIVEAFLASGERVAIGRTRLQIDEVAETRREVAGRAEFGALAGKSEAMRAAFAELRRASLSEHPVLIVGETGTGKELAARAVHAHSARAEAACVLFDCHLEMPASVQELAREGGTVILDEISALPRDRQGELLPLLDRAHDVRVIATTQLNLEELVRRGEFRADVLQRLSAHVVRMPPLRARPEDLGPLAQRILAEAAPGRTLEPELLALLAAHSWPGNVRELRNVLVRGLILGETAPSAGSTKALVPYHEARDRMLGEFEKQYFAEVLARFGGKVPEAAEASGISVPSFYRLIKKAGISTRGE